MVSDTVVINPLEVKVIGNLEKAMKAFRAIVQKEKILSDYKEAQRYEKPSDKKRRKQNSAQQRRLEDEGKATFAPKKHKKNHKFKDKTERPPEPVHELVLAEMHLARKIEQRRAESLVKK